jgi:hypothetical protein
MSAKIFSRDFPQGKVKHASLTKASSSISRRMTQPLTLTLQLPAPRNPVVQALAHRASTSGAGKHIRSRGAHRRADKMALQKAIKTLND